jgi:archaellum component FlaC
MRATWTDTRLDEFAMNVDRRFDELGQRFDGVDKHLDKLDYRLEAVDLRFDEVNRSLSKVDVDVREMKSEISANSRAMLQFCGVMVAAQMATVATLIALFG